MKILLVDDDRFYLTLLQTIFMEAGMNPHCAENGEQALKILTEQSFNIISTDLNMPGMDGLELARRAKAISPATPIIMITSIASPKLIPLAIKSGISTVLDKSVSPKEILRIAKKEQKAKTTTGRNNVPINSGHSIEAVAI